MALPACHYCFTLVHCNGVLNLSWNQRSCDLMLGVPFNIASYALLLTLICQSTNLIPGELVGILEDCHIYENQITGANEQLMRSPTQLPTVKIQSKNIFEWEHTDLEFLNYNPQTKIDFGQVAI
jgi:thymidylate synthase